MKYNVWKNKTYTHKRKYIAKNERKKGGRERDSVEREKRKRERERLKTKELLKNATKDGPTKTLLKLDLFQQSKRTHKILLIVA